MNKKKILACLLALSLLMALAILYHNSNINITPIKLQERIEAKLLKDNEENGVIFKPGVTCTVKGNNLWEVKVTMPELKRCDLSALSILPENKNYNIWLTIPNGNLSVLNDKKVKFLYVEKINYNNHNGSIDLSGLVKNKSLEDLNLIYISEEDIKTLPALPSLVSLSINFSQLSRFDFGTVTTCPKIRNLSFNNVEKFFNPNSSRSEIKSMGLLRCRDYSPIKTLSIQELIFAYMEIDIDYIAKYQANTLKTLVLKDCRLQNTGMLEKMKYLDKLVVINCSPQDRAILDKLSVKGKKIIR